MNITLNHKIIKEKCGLVSYKRGVSFHKGNKVIFEKYKEDLCEAKVRGSEDFHVSIVREKSGVVHTKCSCPTLSSYQKDCQHIAAVLLAVYDQQKHAILPDQLREYDSDIDSYSDKAEDLFSLFHDQEIRASGRQMHFETREILDVAFTCKLIEIAKDQSMLGMAIKVGTTDVENIRDFLWQLKQGHASVLSPTFTYDPSKYCFQEETDTIIGQLFDVVQDEKVYLDARSHQSSIRTSSHQLIIPPSSWERLVSPLTKAPDVKIVYDGTSYAGLHISNQLLPLKFELEAVKSKGCFLKVSGIERLIVLRAYHSVLMDGQFIQLAEEDSFRLSELFQLLERSGKNQIPIHQDQIDFFLEKVVPGLKKLGDVQVDASISKKIVKSPLIAKLYLDRVHHRLLAGLEFHYEKIVINPLDKREIRAIPLFLRDIEKENRIMKFMDESSFTKTEGGYYLQNEELEYEFLYHVEPKLQGLVQIYATTAVRNRISKESSKPMIRVKINKERTNWLEFKFDMDGIPENQIREVLQALEEKRKYYRLPNGSLLSLQTREFEEIQRFLHAAPIQNEDLEKGLDMPITKGFQFINSVDHPGVWMMEDSFRQFLDNLSNPASLEIEVPASVEPILRDYQKHGYNWLKTLAHYGFGGILADDMGLGKTLQSITFLLSELANIRKNERPALIVCPSSLTYNWLSEFMKFAPDVQAVVVDGHQLERAKLQKDIKELDVLITSYPLLRKDIKWYEKQSFHTVFFDEAQAFKNPLTETAKAVKKIQANHRFALTGTPVENSLVELWSIFHIVFPELFLGLKQYSQLTRGQIARMIRPFMLRRMKEDVLVELPEKMESISFVELHPDQKKLYGAYLARLRHDTFKHLDKDSFRKNRLKILAGLTRLRQISCHPALFVDGYQGSSAKFEKLLSILKEAENSGRRVLIFSQFTKMLDLIGKELAIQGQPYFYLDGQTPSAERVDLCNRFNRGERDLFLISLKAGGTGLNLTGADTVILYDLWWNPAVEEQAADRAHRMGQSNVVQVIKLISKGTIEEKMNELQEKKRHLIEEIIDVQGKANLTLTEEDIREILMLNGE